MRYLGIDTSNYTTSTAIFDAETGEIFQCKQLLPVQAGAVGLRQSDAVFAHIKQLGTVMEELMAEVGGPLAGIGVSVRPRDIEGSYMPCFLMGEAAARTAGAAMGIPVRPFSHQAGHIAAALYSARRLDLIGQTFAAFHLSGGTTECLLVSPGEHVPFNVKVFSCSLDLKAGQVIDRVGVMLGLPFPAGKELEILAARSNVKFNCKPKFHGNDCCLSGIENQCAAMWKEGKPPEDVACFCLSMILGALLEMTKKLKMIYADLPIIYAGGVMSNRLLQETVKSVYGGFFAEPAFSSDNAAGIAVLAGRVGEEALD